MGFFQINFHFYYETFDLKTNVHFIWEKKVKFIWKKLKSINKLRIFSKKKQCYQILMVMMIA